TGVAGALGYNIYRDGVLVAMAPAGDIAYFDAVFPVRRHTTYCVEAFNAVGPSPQCCSQVSPVVSVATVASADWYQDCFPADETRGLPGAPGFDLATALIGTGRNIAPYTGDNSRHNIPAAGARLQTTGAVLGADLVFRVVPGVGNYAITGVPGSGLTM